MTKKEENREKEIAQAAKSEYFVTKAEEFAWIHGAEWADQTLIKKIKNVDLSTSGKLYNTWKGIRQRCTNPKATGYKYYGGKGIKVCEEWSSMRKAKLML